MFKFFEKREPVMNPIEDRQLANGESLEATGPEPKGYDFPQASYSSETQEKLDALYKEREAKEQEEAVKWEEQQPLHSYENIEEKFDREIESGMKSSHPNAPVNGETHVSKPFRPKGGERIVENDIDKLAA